VIIGPAGSGKGTQAEKLAKKFDLVHVDMGKTLRQVAKQDTQLGKRIREIIYVKKELVPMDIAKQVLHLNLGSIPREQGLVLDGVPRNEEQRQYIEEALLEFGRKVDQVFFVGISEEKAIKRISRRVVCDKCKAGFILGRDIENLTDPCPLCEGKIIRRADDTEEGVKKRFGVFRQETAPIIEEYRRRGLLFEIDGEKEIEEVFQEILKKLEK